VFLGFLVSVCKATSYPVRIPDTILSLGANREVKKAVEAYWAGKISADDLTKAAAQVKSASWTSVNSKGVDYIPRYDPDSNRDRNSHN
jgi:hypothetical protein